MTLREATVDFAADDVSRKAAIVREGRVDDHTCADPRLVDPRSDGTDLAHNVDALDEWEVEWYALPTNDGVLVRRGSVGALPRPDVGVVHRRCGDAHQRLAVAGLRARPVGVHLDLLRTAVTNGDRRGHRRGHGHLATLADMQRARRSAPR